MEDIISESDSTNRIEFESKVLERWNDFGRAIRARPRPIEVDQSSHHAQTSPIAAASKSG